MTRPTTENWNNVSCVDRSRIYNADNSNKDGWWNCYVVFSRVPWVFSWYFTFTFLKWVRWAHDSNCKRIMIDAILCDDFKCYIWACRCEEDYGTLLFKWLCQNYFWFFEHFNYDYATMILSKPTIACRNEQQNVLWKIKWNVHKWLRTIGMQIRFPTIDFRIYRTSRKNFPHWMFCFKKLGSWSSACNEHNATITC